MKMKEKKETNNRAVARGGRKRRASPAPAGAAATAGTAGADARTP